MCVCVGGGGYCVCGGGDSRLVSDSIKDPTVAVGQLILAVRQHSFGPL